MFDRIFIEEDLKDHPRVLKIQNHFPKAEVKLIENHETIFNKVKKPYLQKREGLNLFLAQKKGTLVKEAPDAYGLAGEPHYYFIHAYNCLYECNYCYLQGYFHSPDIVWFINHEEIIEQMKTLYRDQVDKTNAIWFHAGEYSDSLATSHITGELSEYMDFFRDHPRAKLELRTKSANIKELLKCEPLPNVITSFSLSPKLAIKENDLGTPSLKARLRAMKKLQEAGHLVGVHFDPIIYEDNFEENYRVMIEEMKEEIDFAKIQYISLGVVRFTKDVFSQVKKNYPESIFLKGEFIKSFDGKVRYPRPMRLWMLHKIKSLCLQAGAKEEGIYLCME